MWAMLNMYNNKLLNTYLTREYCKHKWPYLSQQSQQVKLTNHAGIGNITLLVSTNCCRNNVAVAGFKMLIQNRQCGDQSAFGVFKMSIPDGDYVLFAVTYLNPP